MANYCRNCGAKLSPESKFCPECGKRVSVSANGTADPATAFRPVQKQNSPYRKQGGFPSPVGRKKSGSDALAIFLSVVMFVELCLIGFWRPGLLRGNPSGVNESTAYSVQANSESSVKETEYDNTKTSVFNMKEIEVIEPFTAKVNTEQTVVTSGDITVDLGVLDGEHTLEIRDAGETMDESEDAVAHVYDFRLDGGKAQPEAYVAVTVPYDPENEDPLDTVTVRHYDGKADTWTVLPADFDTEAKTVTFYTNHFSPDAIYDTSKSRLLIADYLHGVVADGTVDLGGSYEEYKKDGTGFNWGGAVSGSAIGNIAMPFAGVGAAAGFYIGGKYDEWKNDELFLYNQQDIREGKGALSRVSFNANRLEQIANSIDVRFNALEAVAKGELDWQNDMSLTGKAALATGFGGNGVTTFDNSQQIIASMGKIASGTSKVLSRAFFVVGAVLTAVKFGLSWYDSGGFTSALRQNAADIGLVALGGLSLATGGTAGVAIGIVAAGVWAVTTVVSAYKDADATHITGLRNGHYDNDTQRVYMMFTKNFIAYSALADASGKWPGGLTFSSNFPKDMEKTREYLFNTYHTYGFNDSKNLGNERNDKNLSQWKNYLNRKAYAKSGDTASLSRNIDACFANAAGVFWKLPATFRKELAKDFGVYGYREPGSGEIATYKEQMRKVLAMLNSRNIEFFFNQYRAKAREDALKNINELTDAMNTVTGFSFYVMETQANGEQKKVPLKESRYKGYIAAFCPGKGTAPRNAGYGTADDWIFKTGSDPVQFQCTAYNWLKSGGEGRPALGWIRLFENEKALRLNVSAADASFAFSSPGVEVIFGEEGVWELQGLRYIQHYKWTGKNGGTISEKWTELKVNENATSYSYKISEAGETQEGGGMLPGTLATAGQLANVFTEEMVRDNAMIARLIEGVPEGYDFGKANIRDLDGYNNDIHYLFQEAGAGKESLFRSAAANADAEGSRILMVEMPGVTLIYRERSREAASADRWQIYAVEQLDSWQ